MKRQIIEIDEEKCTGCGLCIRDCAEGALALVNGKATLIRDTYCDGLGACLGACPEGALTIIEREAPEFDEKEALAAKRNSEGVPASGCPGTAARALKPLSPVPVQCTSLEAGALSNWPIQLRLVPVNAPFLHRARLLIAADCTAFAQPRQLAQLLPGRMLLIACPKLDETTAYIEKLAHIFRTQEIQNITILHMTVPCCTGLVSLVDAALRASGKDIPRTVEIVSAQ